MLLSLAFVFLNYVPLIFSLLENDVPEDLLLIFEYFENYCSWKANSRKKTGHSSTLPTSYLESAPSSSDWFA